MTTLQLYHGSQVLVEYPALEKCRLFNDYGPAFYCTESIELAKEWACGLGADGIANCYELELDGLRLLDLNSSRYCLLHWLDVLLQNRRVSATSPTARRAMAWLHANYAVDLGAFDVVRGYRADDSYFSFARAFLRNEITLAQLGRAMRLGKLGEQYALRTQRAFDALAFAGWEHVDAGVYWPLRSARDAAARDSFAAMLAEEPASSDAVAGQGALYISTLMAMGEEELHASVF